MLNQRFENIKTWLSNKKNVRALIFAIVLTSIIFLGQNYLGNYFDKAMMTIIITMIGLLLVLFMSLAAYAVLKALFLVAVEISLLIYIAQSYCDVPNRVVNSDDALRSLMVVGLAYIVIAFLYQLNLLLDPYIKKFERERKTKEIVISITIFLFFLAFFIQQIYLVLNPIIINLCVYK